MPPGLASLILLLQQKNSRIIIIAEKLKPGKFSDGYWRKVILYPKHYQS